MMFNNIYDSHCHSNNSHDGHNSVDEMCITAIDRGINGFALTDHCEVDLYRGEYINRVDNSFKDIILAKEKYKDKLLLSAGIELGQANFDVKLASEILKKHNYDFVIASTHGIGDSGDLCNVNYSNMTINEVNNLLDRYFKYYLEMVSICDFDTAAHLTYPLRYIEGVYNIKVDLNRYIDIIDEIFKTIVSRGKALELNTSGLRQNIKKPFPTIDLIKRYLDFGGELITIGSDSHRISDMAADFTTSLEFLEYLGLKYYSFYQNRQPNMISIITR